MSDHLDDIPSDLTLSQSLGLALTKDLATDVNFNIGTERKEMKAHKIILMARSPVFRAMFAGPLAESGNIDIPDTTEHSFSVFLRYFDIYSSKKVTHYILVYRQVQIIVAVTCVLYTSMS